MGEQQKPRVICLAPFPASESWREALGERVQVLYASLEDVLANPSAYNDVVGLLPLITHQVTLPLMAALPNLKLIANYGAGVDNIDVVEATRRGIQVTNTPGVLSESTADLAFALILAVCRRLVESHAVMAANAFSGWAPDYQLGIDVHGKTLGIVGMGQIGTVLSRRAKGFDMPVLYTQRTRLPLSEETALDVSYRSFEDLLRQSDIVSIHTPLTPGTRHLFNKETLLKMKSRAVLINTARGPVVDEAALAEVLASGHLFGAGLDVYEDEPHVHPALVGLPNVVLAAHIGSATTETRQKMGDLVFQNLLAYLGGDPVPNPVT